MQGCKKNLGVKLMEGGIILYMSASEEGLTTALPFGAKREMLFGFSNDQGAV